MTANRLTKYTTLYFLSIAGVVLQAQHISAKEVDFNGGGFGIEFFTKVAGERTLTIENVIFNGFGDQPLTETQVVDVDIDIDWPAYDVSLFYRWGRIKIGWLPTSLIHDDNYREYVAQYNQPFGAWPLGRYDVSAEFINLFYLEVLGMKTRNMLASLAMRLDNAEIEGDLLTIKYPFGDEWFQSPIILNREEVDEEFLVLSLGPKIRYDLKTIHVLDTTLEYFRRAGLDISVLWDIPMDNSDFEGYAVNISLGLEF